MVDSNGLVCVLGVASLSQNKNHRATAKKTLNCQSTINFENVTIKLSLDEKSFGLFLYIGGIIILVCG